MEAKLGTGIATLIVGLHPYATFLSQPPLLPYLPPSPLPGVGMALRLVADLVGTIFDIPSAAVAMKDDVWKRRVKELFTVSIRIV